MFMSTCPLKVKISQGLGPFFQIELVKTGRTDNGGHAYTAEPIPRAL